MAARIVSPELIGRQAELDVIAEALADARRGHGRTVLVGGEAGIGKTRLVAEALERARAEGAFVLLGGCIGLTEGALPFGAIVEAIRPLVRGGRWPRLYGAPAPMVAAAAGGAASPVAPAIGSEEPGGEASPEPEGRDRIAEALHGVASDLGLLPRGRSGAEPSAELRPEWARSQTYEAFLELLRGLSRERPVVLAIEDLHWADDSTRELLAFLVRNARNERLVLLVTFRSDELHRRHPLLFWLVEVGRSSGVERLELRRLDRAGVARQLSGILGQRADPSLVESVFARSDGNPFFAEQLIAAGVETNRLPPTLREALAARLANVTEPTMELLGVAAVVGRQVDHDLLLRVSGLSDEALDDALNEAVSAMLLRADDTASSERYTFRHALLAEAAAETVLPGHRRRLHAAIAAALAEAGGLRGAEEAGRLAEIAHHWFEAREIERAFAAAVAAGNAALGTDAYAEAVRQYERAVDLWDVVGDPEPVAGMDRIELLRRAAHVSQLSGEYQRASQLLREAIGLAQERGDDVRPGLLLERLGRSLWTSGDVAGSEEAYRRAVELVPEELSADDHAQVLSGYAQVLMLSGHLSDSRAAAEKALRLARAAGNRQLEGHALCTLGVDLGFVGDPDEGVELLRQAIEIGAEVGAYDDLGRAYANLSSVLDTAGRREEALAVALEGGRRLRELGLAATYAAFVDMNAADELVSLGRWDEALEIIARDAAIVSGTSYIFAETGLATVMTLRGEFEAAERALREAEDTLGRGVEAQFGAPLAVTEVNLATLRGDFARGRRVADRVLPILAQTEDGPNHARVLATALRIEADAGERARAERDDAAFAEAVRRRDAWLGELHEVAGRSNAPAVRTHVAQLAALGEAEASRLGTAPDAAAWRRARELAMARGTVFDVAYTTFRLAEALLGSRASRDEAAALLADAHGVAARLRARPLRELIEALAARARVALAAPATPSGEIPRQATEPRPRESRGALEAYGLSAREVEVLRLLAAGRTNRQIGEALFISESTAGVHVSHILTKLNVAGRVEAATIAARLGLAPEPAE